MANVGSCPRCSAAWAGQECGSCGWRKGWRAPKPKPPPAEPALTAMEVAERRARAREAAVGALANEPLPSPGDLYDEMRGVLRGLALEAEEERVRLGAAAKLAELSQTGDPLEILVAKLGGDKREALAWLESAAEKIRREMGEGEGGGE